MDISLDDMNHFETPRMVASKINEDRQLSDLPGNKSMTFEFAMTSVDDNVSPAIDLDRVSTILTTNRINSPVSDFGHFLTVFFVGEFTSFNSKSVPP